MAEARRGEAKIASEREMVVTRVFDAPRELVWEAWTKAEHLARWFGPRGFSLPVCEIDFRPGGAYRFVMRGPDGTDYPFHGLYREIAPPARIVFTAILDDEGNDELLTTVTLDEDGRKTRVTVRQTVPRSPMAARGQEQGWRENLERLGEHLAGA